MWPGFAIRELSPVVSNWRAQTSLADYLEKNGIPGIQGIDTRALTKKLRVRGALNGFISTATVVAGEEAVERAQDWPGLVGVDYVKEVTHKQAVSVGRGRSGRAGISTCRAEPANAPQPAALPPADIPIVAFDYGMKYNILRRLRQHGFQGARRAGDGHGRRGAGQSAGGHLSFQWPGRSRRPWAMRCRR